MSTASWRSPADTLYSGVTRVQQRARRDSGRVPATPPSGAELEVRFLSELVAAHADVRSSIDVALSSRSTRGPDLVALRGDLRRRLDQLLDELLGFCEERDAIDALVPFVFFVDEQVEHALAVATDPGTSTWLQLQCDLFPERRAEGGDVFFERAGQLLSEKPARTTVVAAYLFCLKASFRGRLADEPDEAAEQWVRALAEQLPSRVQRSVTRVGAWHTPRRTGTYVVAAVAATIVWHLLVSVWAYLR